MSYEESLRVLWEVPLSRLAFWLEVRYGDFLLRERSCVRWVLV